MWLVRSGIGVLFALCLAAAKLRGADLVERVSDVKDLKKVLRTKTNVLVVYSMGDEEEKSLKKILPVIYQAAEIAYGKGSIVFVNCGCTEGKKLCKKYKVTPEPIALKHYHNGEFHKDYDRAMQAESMGRFLLDPTGDAPWEEEPTAKDVVHVTDPSMWKKLLKQEKRPILSMFYAPWCGFCKKLKPDYAEAATELKETAILAAMDVTRPENNEIQSRYNITGYPTIIYFENGKAKFPFSGDNNKAGIVKWMQNPGPAAEKPVEKSWKEEGGDVVHLTDADFHPFVTANPSVLVMFYAPWCGHCKRMKPDYSAVASQLKASGAKGVLAAVDATVEKKVAEEFKITGFPTIKYFKDGAFAWDFNAREKEKILEFMEDPQEPAPPPPPETPWKEEEGDVLHLTAENFKAELKRKKHALVMFYAPWCGHCKAAKPEFSAAATELASDPKIALAAVDCTSDNEICSEYEVKGFPTILYISYGKNPTPYNMGRNKKGFMDFMLKAAGVETAEETEFVINEPATTPPPPPPEEEWGSGVLQLTDTTFNTALMGKRGLVMFYAPWCGHCKKAKPEYIKAAEGLSDGQFLAAMDCTKFSAFCGEKGVKGYPTFQIYQDGVFAEAYKGARQADAFLKAVQSTTAAKTEL